MCKYTACVGWEGAVFGLLRDLGEHIYSAAIEYGHSQVQDTDEKQQEDADASGKLKQWAFGPDVQQAAPQRCIPRAVWLCLSGCSTG